MLGRNHSLYFPKLSYQKHVSFGSWGNSNDKKSSCPVYKLDWSYKEQKCQEDHDKWLKQCHPNKKIPLHPDLPQKYEEWVKGMLFAIPNDYLKEIREHSQRGLAEWDKERGFDTNVREYCLKSAIAHIDIAFYLIGDCAYDPEENYFYRGDDKFLLHHVMGYKFWSNQTGRGLIKHHSGLDELETRFVTGFVCRDGSIRKLKDPDRQSIIKEFLDDIRELEDLRDEAMKNISVEEEDEDIDIRYSIPKESENGRICVYFKDDHFAEISTNSEVASMMFADADNVYVISDKNVTIIKDRGRCNGVQGPQEWFNEHMGEMIKKQYPGKKMVSQEIGRTINLKPYSVCKRSSKNGYWIRKTYMG